jgi:hypothetical protein
MKDMENFQEKIDSFSNKFEELIEKDFNITLNKIDDLIISAKNLREYYVKTYKEKKWYLIIVIYLIVCSVYCYIAFLELSSTWCNVCILNVYT